MNATLVLGFTAFLFCLGLTPLCRSVFLRLNLVDKPDRVRKLHQKAIPRLGGIPIVLSYVGALALVIFLGPKTDGIYVAHKQLLWSLLPATGLVFLTGVMDDLFCLKPWQKLAGQLIAGLIAISHGAILSEINGHATSLWLSVPLSLFWLIACTNALNLIDGIDGLAAGVGLLASLTTLIVAVFSHNPGLAAATVPLVGCLLAFLYYNFNPASIFLGDCGSLTIGFMLGCFGLIWSRNTGGMLGIAAAPLMTLSLPLIDVCLSISRRYLRSDPIFKGDRGHIHHMIVERGFNQRAAALILYGVCVIAAMFALTERFGGYKYHGVIIALFCILVCLGVNYLGYVEISAARRALSKKTVLGAVKEEIFLQQLNTAIDKIHTVQDCWSVVLSISPYMQFSTVAMEMHTFSYSHAFPSDTNGDHAWSIVLPLGDSGSLSVTGSAAHEPPAYMMRALGTLQRELSTRQIIATAAQSEALAGVESHEAFQASPTPQEHLARVSSRNTSGSQTADAA